MIALVQRVSSASVRVGGEVVGEVGRGLLVLLGVVTGDTDAEGAWLADKVARLRVFPDDDGRMNRSLGDVGGGALVVSPVHARRRRPQGDPAQLRPCRPARGGRAALRRVLRRALRAPGRGGRARRVRGDDGGRARERRAGDAVGRAAAPPGVGRPA